MFWSQMRIAAAVMALCAVGAGLVVNVDRAARQGQDLAAVLANYFSLFTIVSSSLGAAVLVAAAVWDMRNRGDSREPVAIALALAAVSGPILLLGVVYNVLLRGIPSAVALGDTAGIAMLDEFAIEVLHVVLPLYVLFDLLAAPRRRGLSWRMLPVIVGYPLTWTVYTMVRGERVANPDGTTPWWYPYPFLDPHGAGGYGTALTYIGGILIAFLAIGSGIIAIGRYRERRATRRHTATPMIGAAPA
ncbi:Pr6Pr family membrane protein [Microbacter sp. GSS18]|nr:Pr6Pr family membrane protein [Microbacter sp. GSS18]